MSPEGTIPLIHCREEECFKILIIFQGIFSLSTDLGGPSAWYIDNLDSLKWEVKTEMFKAIRCTAMRLTLITAKQESGKLLQPK